MNQHRAAVELDTEEDFEVTSTKMLRIVEGPTFARGYGWILVAAALLVSTALSCGPPGSGDESRSRREHIPTPDRSQIQVIDQATPAGLTDTAAIAAYQQGYSHMRVAAWFAALAAYDEALRIQPHVAGLYEATGTAYLYADKHNQLSRIICPSKSPFGRG